MEYKLKNRIALESENEEFFIIDQETGFVGKGNKCSYQVLSQLREWTSIPCIVEALKSAYPEDQYARIEKAIPKIVQWSEERGLLESRAA